MKTFSAYLLFTLVAIVTFSCTQKSSEEQPKESFALNDEAVENLNSFELSEDFKSYWYAGDAEITSYKLEQARYGEIRNGHAVLIYVTEDFRPESQVKADRSNPDNVSVLKLNATKKFNTGIYPYSVMQSTFYPVSNAQHAMKVSASMQEWCGHVYAQLNNRDQFEVISHSYFESEADQGLKLDKVLLENEIWTKLRIDPSSLPQGDIQIIPSFEFMRLKHVDMKAYAATATNSEGSFSLDYPELNRSLVIQYMPEFPYEILGWEETFKSGFGPNAKSLTTKATKLTSLKSAYWGKNSNKDEVLRKTLLLE